MDDFENIEYDSETRKWFMKNITAQTTVMRCELCGLFYKPSLGHECKKQKETIDKQR